MLRLCAAVDGTRQTQGRISANAVLLSGSGRAAHAPSRPAHSSPGAASADAERLATIAKSDGHNIRICAREARQIGILRTTSRRTHRTRSPVQCRSRRKRANHETTTWRRQSRRGMPRREGPTGSQPAGLTACCCLQLATSEMPRSVFDAFVHLSAIVLRRQIPKWPRALQAVQWQR